MQLFRNLAIASLIAFSAAAAPPAPSDVLGWSIGERFTPHHRIVDYFERLASERPERISLVQFGETWERRPLLYVVITSAENQARLEQIRGELAAISDPRRTTRAEADRIASSTPALVWLAFGVHGDESSSAEAAMMVAHRLAGDEPEIATILENTVVIIDPLQNPDGRERYIQWFESRVGRTPDPEPEALEHYQPWPGGRYNHYLVDMNRDWMWASQVESRARVAAYLRWNPQVFVDFHEMGHATSYFFPPDADPINANIDPQTEVWLERFGKANADAFSERGWPFFVGERFDLFYPGYGDSWPSLRGAVGMTYEMAGHGFAGRAVRREDGTVLTLAERVGKHFTTAMATLATAAANRRELVRHTWDVVNRQLGLAETTYLIPRGSPSFHAAAELLAAQHLEFGILSAPREVSAARVTGGPASPQQFPGGTLVVSTRQPAGAVVRTLFEKSPQIDPAFIEMQRTRIDADEPDQFYDVTAWSLPVAYDLRAWMVDGAIPRDAVAPWSEPLAPAPPAPAQVGWIVDGADPALYRLAGELLRREIRFSVIDAELRHTGRSFARGSLLVQKHNNSPAVHEALATIAREIPATLIAVDSGWSGGLALGSDRIVFVRDPRIALVGGPGTAPTSFGSLWHTFDRTVRIPHSNLSLERLGSTDLSKFRVLVFPDGGGYGSALDKEDLARLKTWVESGNTLIAIRRAASILRNEDAGISATKLWEPPKPTNGNAAEPPTARYNDFSVPGAAFRTTMNSRSFLTFGVESAPPVLIEGSDVLLPVPHGVDNIVTIAKESPLTAGFAWPESIERLQGSAWLVVEPVGEGRVITFAGEPFFRSFWRGTLPFLLNAALYSPSF